MRPGGFSPRSDDPDSTCHGQVWASMRPGGFSPRSVRAYLACEESLTMLQ